ncbi:hypothetical protein ZIOFF_054172 [Zingiber officinale]|uniref:Exoribonuclease phosphorolytic domain-containing protein n=1 Tax=Zingiber officinale TaxID=94328 RepID=A0A8J5F917_ZINOF|nr:hypothetical protein ZIOFF_054172 [Zingiber officinale]
MGAEPPSLATTKLGFPYTATKLIFPMRPSLSATKLGFPSLDDPSPTDKLVRRVIKLQISILTVSLVTALSFIRQIRAEIGVVAKADGSALFEMGNTKVIAAVYRPTEVQNKGQQINNQALVSLLCAVSIAWLISAQGIYKKTKGGQDRRCTEISLVICQTMEACILVHLMPCSQIDIFVQVLQADGDLNYVEDSARGPDVTVGILAKMDKMGSKLPIDIFENVMQLAIEGCKAIAQYIREVLLENTKLLESRKGL